MFASESGAIEDFLDKATRACDRARGQLAEAERMVAWAEIAASSSTATERQDDRRDLMEDAWLAGARHCDDYINDESAHPALRAFLARARSPAHGMMSVDPLLVLFADYRGQRVRVVMASRLGDVGIVSSLSLADDGSRSSARFAAYETRVAVGELSNFGVAP